METTPTPLPQGNIKLRDGRRLAYAEYGDPQGKPVLFFHGTPGSRLFHHPDDSVAASTGARIITVDRPGFGRSDFKPGRKLLDWPNDVVQLADALGLQKFAVLGYSGGGPYAAACAMSIPDRLTATGLVGSIAPLDNPQIARGMHGMGHVFFSLDRHLPSMAKLACRLMCTTWRNNPDLYFKSQVDGLRNSEEARALRPKVKAMLTADFMEAVRNGTQGVTFDLELLSRPWGFNLHVIESEVFLWHGESDTQAPVAMGKRLASAIPHCRATFFPREGHWAIYGHWREILTALLQTQAAPSEEPLPTEVVVAIQANNLVSETVVPPDFSGMAFSEAPADATQGLPPAQEAADVAPGEAAESNTTREPIEASSALLAAILDTIDLEPEPAPEAPEPVSEKKAGRPTAAISEAADSTSPEPEPAPEAPEKVSKKKAGRRTVAISEAAHSVSPDPEPEQKARRPVSKKTAGHHTAATVDSPTKPVKKSKAAPEKATTVARNTAQRPAATTTGVPGRDSSKPEPVTGKPKVSAKRSTKPRVEPLSKGAPENAQPAPETAEPTPRKSSSGRKASKEATLV